MKTTKLQAALRTGLMTPEDVQLKLGIMVKSHKQYENLKLFKYNQIASPMGDPLVQSARGIILDMANDWNIVSFPFTKFFNDGEGHAAKIDWSTARVQEKLDGSLMSLYHYDGKWHVASSGTPDASGKVHGLDMSFADLFWKTWNDLGYELPVEGLENYTFMFEMMTPFNRVVVPYKESKLVLIGVRHNVTLQEASLAHFYGMDWQTVKEFPLTNLEDVIRSFDTFKGIDQEGYVVVDANFNRVKIKHPGYVALHHLKGDDGPSYKKMIKIVTSGEGSEILTYFPEWKPIYDKVHRDLSPDRAMEILGLKDE